MQIISVTGAPGTGKTLLSTEIARKLNAQHIDINKIVKEDGLILGKEEKVNTVTVDLDALRKKIELLSSRTNGANLILDGHLSHLIPSPEKVKIVFVLRCDPRILRKRLEKRAYSLDKIKENVLAEILDVCLIESLNRFGKEKVCEIDTSRRSLDENLKFAMEVLIYKIRPVSGQIDWITMLESENKLKEYIEW